MHYQPVVDRFPIPVPLDPIAFAAFAAVFAAVALATARRPSHGLAALLFVQPFAWYHYVLGTSVTFPKVVLVGAIVGLIRYHSAIQSLREKHLRSVAWPLIAILLATGLSIVHAVHHDAVIREALKALEYLALAAAAYALYRLDARDLLLNRAFGLSVICVALSALAEEMTGAPSGLWMNGHPVPRIAGLLEGPNQLAGYLEVATALLGAWSIQRRSALSDVALALSGCVLVLTFSRGGIVGNAIAVAALAAIYGRACIRGLFPFGIGIVFGALGAGVWAILAHSGNLFRVTSMQSNYAGGVGNRSELWRAALYFFRSSPIVGIGAGNYELELARAGVFGVRTHANSWYLQSLAEGGIVLFCTVVAFVVATVRALARGVRRSPWTAGAFAATLALALHQIFDFLIFYPKVGGPWILAIALGLAAMASGSE